MLPAIRFEADQIIPTTEALRARSRMAAVFPLTLRSVAVDPFRLPRYFFFFAAFFLAFLAFFFAAMMSSS